MRDITALILVLIGIALIITSIATPILLHENSNAGMYADCLYVCKYE